MRLRAFSALVLVFVLSLLAHSAYADATVLGTAASFAVLAGSAVDNTGSSVIYGNLGVSPGLAISNFPPGIVNGTVDAGNTTAALAQGDLVTAFNTLASKPTTSNLTGQDLGGLTLTPGVYKFDSSAQLTGTLTLNALGNPDAVWVFQIGSTLTTASASSVVIINQGSNANNGLFWEVGSSATLGTTTDFLGNIVALTAITLNTGATDNCGRVLARNAAVTLDTNTIGSLGCQNLGESASGGLSGGGGSATTPEPGTLLLVGCGFFGFLVLRRHP